MDLALNTTPTGFPCPLVSDCGWLHECQPCDCDIQGSPILTQPPNQTAQEGVSKLFDLGSFSDPCGHGPWTVTVNWGDDDLSEIFTVEAPGMLTRAHAFADQGTYSVFISVNNADGIYSESKSFLVSVVEDLPVLTPPPDQMAQEGSSKLFDLGSLS